MKKVILILVAISVMASLLVFAVSAADTMLNVEYTHYLEGGDNSDNINIYGNPVDSYKILKIYTCNGNITDFVVPLVSADSLDINYSFLFTFFPLFGHSSSDQYYILSNGCKLKCNYNEIAGLINISLIYPKDESTEEMHLFSSVNQDIMLYYDASGKLNYARYNMVTGQVEETFPVNVNAVEYLKSSIFSKGQMGNVDKTYSDGYDEGYRDGYLASGGGINTDTIREMIESARSDGYSKGYLQGKQDTIKNYDKDTNYWYNLGLQDGQDADNIVFGAINGFFSGLTAFFSPFMSIGIGSLTVYTIVGLAIIIAIAILIVKLVKLFV